MNATGTNEGRTMNATVETYQMVAQNGRPIKAICVWRDSTSNPKLWVVSRDELDHDGGAESSRTLKGYTDKDEALASGRAIAAAENLPLYYHPESGPKVIRDP